MALTPTQRAIRKLKKRKGTPLSRFNQAIVILDFTIPDINFGGWSFIDEPVSPDYRKREKLIDSFL